MNNKYIINGDGTITDNSTHLMWQQETVGPMTWAEAVEYCRNLRLGRYDNWRLPGRKDLFSLLDDDRYNPSINLVYFPNTLLSYYWSSTTYAGSTNVAWCVYFNDGFVNGIGYKSSAYYVRAVRSGQD